jgi:uncharacterized protein
MKNYVLFLDRFKKLIIVSILAVTVLFGYFLKDLSFDGSYRIWFGEESTILKDYDNFKNTFGNDSSVLIAFKDENGIFQSKAVESIRRITQELWQTKYIARVDSLTNYQYIHVDKEFPDDILVEDFLPLGLSYDELVAKKEIAINDPLILGKLINKDATTTLMVARMTPKAGENEDTSIELYSLVEDILKKEKKLTGYEYIQLGDPAINSSFEEIASRDGGIFMPLAIGMVALLLVIVFRSASAAIIPMIIVISSFTIVLSSQVLLGDKLNNFTVNIPTFIMAITIAATLHIYSVWQNMINSGKERIDAVVISLEKNFKPVFLTSLTTSIGFMSLSISEIVPVKTLGVSTAIGAVLAFILSVTLMPSLLLLLKPKKIAHEKQTKKSQAFQKYGEFIVQNDKKIVLFTLVVFVLLAIGIKDARIDSNTIRYFDESVDIRKDTNFIEQNLAGSMSYEVVVDSKENSGIKDPKFLATVDRFYKELSQNYADDVRSISSLLDILKRFNEVFHGEDKSYFKVPDSKELNAQFLLLYSLSLPQGMEINDKVDIQERLLRVTVSTNIVDTSKDLEMINWIESWWQNTPYSSKVNGQTAMFAYMQSSVTDTLINSMLLAIGAISLVMIAIFRRIKLLAIFVLPNILPVILVLGVMGYMRIDIDLGVAVSAAIIIGVAVDDTIHFLIKFFDSQKMGITLQESFAYVLEYAGSAMILTTVILSVAFLSFLGSVFMPNVHFGIITATALCLALVADLLLLPAVLSLVFKSV